MNDVLVGLLGIINLFLAIILVVGGGLIGMEFARSDYFRFQFGTINPDAALIIGGLTGLVLAAVFCGSIAALVNISRRLTQIKGILQRRG
ncbi:MAG: hypothetical protein AAGM04_09385 [Pseudomonadota bacterium]